VPQVAANPSPAAGVAIAVKTSRIRIQEPITSFTPFTRPVLKRGRGAANVREYLPPDVVPADEAKRLYSLRTRLGDSFAALRKGGVRGFRDREDYVRAVSEVAFQRYRETRARS
jgi:hypothetical protein